MTVSKSTSGQNVDSDDDDALIEDVIRKTLMKGGTTIYTKGDKIKAIKGDLTGIKGTVLAIEEGGLVTFKPLNLPALGDKPLQIDISMLTKYFEPSDLIRVTEGKYKGDTGRVIELEKGTNRVTVLLDQNQQEIKITANQLKLKSDTDQPMSANILAAGKNLGYKAGDLVNYNGNKNAGYVLQV